MRRTGTAPIVQALPPLVQLEEVSLYVHVPFCSSRCRYCDFYFETGRSPRVMQSTLDRILGESDHYAEMLGHPIISSIYFGGGTPSVLPPQMLDSFLARFRDIWRISAEGSRREWNFEANPESVSGELLSVLEAHGVNRLSIGVQSFQDDELRLLGRRARRPVSIAALELVASSRRQVPHLNIDLMTGVPGQTALSVSQNVETAVLFEPDHFSLYSLTIEEGTPLARMIDYGSVQMPTDDEQEATWFAARDAVTGHGFASYEVSNFARPGAESAHNLRYWSLEPYLGLGPGAVSTLLAGGNVDRREVVPVRITNPDLFVYGAHPANALPREVEQISARDFLFEHFITGLRTREGVSLDRLSSIFGEGPVAALEPLVADWRERGLLAAKQPDRQAQRVLSLSEPERLKLDRHLLSLKGVIDAAPVPDRMQGLLAKNGGFSYK